MNEHLDAGDQRIVLVRRIAAAHPADAAANVNLAVNGLSFGATPTPAWMAWTRLPLQGVLIAWAWAVTGVG